MNSNVKATIDMEFNWKRKEWWKKGTRCSMKYDIKSKWEGSCRRCPEPVQEGKTFCSFHLEQRRKRSEELRNRYKKEGKCIQCGILLDEDDGLCRCVSCAESNRESKRRRN